MSATIIQFIPRPNPKRLEQQAVEILKLIDDQPLVQTEGDCWPWKQDDGTSA